MITGYFIKGTREEYLMVLRSKDIENMRTLIDRLGRMRDKDIKNLVKELSFSLERIDSEQP